MEKIAQSGSSRQYFRTDDGKILCHGTSRRENEAFITLARNFHAAGLPVPEIYEVAEDGMSYFQQDVGRNSLFDLLSTPQAPELLDQTMKLLADFHDRGTLAADFSVCYPVAEMTRESVMWDLNYFKYCYLKSTREIDEPELEKDFNTLADKIISSPRDVFMIRDFQSRNVMVDDQGRLSLIDFQGGRRGAREYDVASFLWQARAGFSPAKRNELIDKYLAYAAETGFTDVEGFKKHLPWFVLLRILQTLGAYGFRGTSQGNALFQASTATALFNLKALIKEHGFNELPYLRLIFGPNPLTVRLISFSYKKGLPADDTGNGGGFIFDCRFAKNPGRYDEFKPLTGRDAAVKEFLDREGEMSELVNDAVKISERAIQKYLKRDFESLQIAFGCTGGRHRSVYGAEQTAKRLKSLFPEVKFEIIHREFPELNS